MPRPGSFSTAARIAAALVLAATLAIGPSPAAAPPKIAKPRPVAPGEPTNVPPLPPADFDPTLTIGGDDLQAKMANTRLKVDVFVNGAGPYKFVVDSGADTSVVGRRIARDLELPLGMPAILNSTTSRDWVDRVRVAELTLGPSTIRDLHVPALAERDVGGDGMIGIDALVQQRLLMDFEKRLIRVEDARKPPRPEPGEIVVTARRQRGQLILTHVQTSGISLDAVIDTGSEVSIGNTALRDRLFRRGRNFTTVEAIGVTGATMKLEMTTVDELRLGPVTLYDVPIAFADVPPFKLFGLADEPALLVGTDLLETFRRVSLDFRARKVRFQLRRCGMDGVVLSTSTSTSLTRIMGKGGPDLCGR